MTDFGINQEVKRMQLERILEGLRLRNVDARLEKLDEDNDYVIFVPVFGPEELDAQFIMDVSDDEELTLFGTYFSDIIEAPISISWVFQLDFDLVELVDEILDFTEECFVREHESMIDIESINDDNLETFFALLPDSTLTEKDIYAMGIILKADEGRIPVGTLSFRVADSELIIEDIFVYEDYRDMGIATYVVKCVKDTIS